MSEMDIRIDALAGLVTRIEREVDEQIPPARVMDRLRAARDAVHRPESGRPSGLSLDELAEVTSGVTQRATGPHIPRPRRSLLFAATAAAGALITIGGVQAALRRSLTMDSPVLSPEPTPPPEQDEGVLWRVALGRKGSLVGAANAHAVITVDGPVAFASDARDGRRLWTDSFTTASVSAWLWGDKVVAADARTLWIFDTTTGETRAVTELAAMEEHNYSKDNPEGTVVQIKDILPAGQHAVVSLTTALIVISTSGQSVWRVPRPFDAQGRRGSPPRPMFADSEYVICQETGVQSRLTMRRLRNGGTVWQMPNTFPQSEVPPPLPPGGALSVSDPAWTRLEGRAVDGTVVLRDGPNVQVRRQIDGKVLWHTVSQTPVAAMEVVDGQIVVSAGDLVARRIDSGAVTWQIPKRGAQLAIPPALTGLVAADGDGLAVLDLQGRLLRQVPWPISVRESVFVKMTANERAAYAVFRKRDDTTELVALPLDV